MIGVRSNLRCITRLATVSSSSPPEVVASASPESPPKPAPLRLRLPALPSISDLVKLYRLKAIKQLSQNFLLDDKLTSKFVKAAGKIEDGYVCEVGPGPGGITRSIISRNPKKIILIERDKRFASALNLLRSSCHPGLCDIYWGDVLSFQMSELFPKELKKDWDDDYPPPIHILGNLPFSIATPLIIKWLRAMSQRTNAWSFGRVPLTLTFQLEVAERLVAPPDGDQRSRLSIMAQYLCNVKHKFTIPGSAFVPKPDVDVGIVKFTPRKEPLLRHDFDLVEKFVRHTFSMRQKFCRRGISTLFPEMVRTRFTLELFKNSGVVTTRRPFELTMEEFSSLIDAYAEICERYPQLTKYHYRGFRPDEEWEASYAHAFQEFKMDKYHVKELDPKGADDTDGDKLQPDERFR